MENAPNKKKSTEEISKDENKAEHIGVNYEREHEVLHIRFIMYSSIYCL